MVVYRGSMRKRFSIRYPTSFLIHPSLSKPPGFAAERGDARGVGGVAGGVVNRCEVKGFAAFDASATAAAVQRAAFVAGPGLGKGHPQFGAAAHDIGLGPIDEGADELNGGPVSEADGLGHGVGEGVAAVGVDCVVAGVGRVGDLPGLDGEGVASGERQEDHIAVGHHGALHRLLGVVPLGHFDLGRG